MAYCGTTSAFAGLPADEVFHFRSYLHASTKYSLAPNYHHNKSVAVTVDCTS